MTEMRIDIAGERLILDVNRAIWWSQAKSLLLADVHFGKGSVLRQSGIAVPTGQTASDLERLDRLIERYQPHEVLVLGDLVHGGSPIDARWVQQVKEWRQRHKNIAMRLIAGNHDRHFDPEHLGFEVIPHALQVGPFVLSHEPIPCDQGYVLAGHVHPGISVRDGWRRHRLPAFRFGVGAAVLPAFGSLTGLQEYSPAEGERIVAVTPAGLLDVSGTTGKKRSRPGQS